MDLLLLLSLLFSFCYKSKKHFSVSLVVLGLPLWFLERLVWYPNQGVSQPCRPHLTIVLDNISLIIFVYVYLVHTINGKWKFSLDHTTLLRRFLKCVDVIFLFYFLQFGFTIHCPMPSNKLEPVNFLSSCIFLLIRLLSSTSSFKINIWIWK